MQSIELQWANVNSRARGVPAKLGQPECGFTHNSYTLQTFR